jgi:phosphate starvation-inducible PhoH-like protein
MEFEVPISEKARKRQLRKQVKAKRNENRRTIPLTPKNESQKFYLDCLKDSDQIFAIGPAGTGKTYIAARVAMKALSLGDIEQIYVARPTVSMGKHRMGFLPGKLDAKMKPWFIPIVDAFKDEVPAALYDKFYQEGKIEFVSFEHIRGRTFSDSFVILDEAQNCTLHDLKTFLTRIGEDTQLVVCGDLDQCDIPDSGLDEVVSMIEKFDLNASVCDFLASDVVRSKIAQEWVTAFSKVK